MEYYYEEYEGKVWSEEQIREYLFKGVLDTLRGDAMEYIKHKYNDTLDTNVELLKVATNNNIEDVIEEITNVDRYHFVNVDEVINSEEFTNNVDNLKKAIEFFGKYYRACNGVYGKFEYQCIESKYVENLKQLSYTLQNVEGIIAKMEKEFE